MENSVRIKLKQNPQEKANFFSKITFLYTIPVFLKGYSKDLDEEDMYETLSVHQSSRLGKRLEESWLKECEGKNPSLWKALGRIFVGEYILLGLVLIIMDGFAKISQLLALAELMGLYQVNSANHDPKQAYIYASVIIGTSCANAFFFNWYSLQVDHLGMQIRLALSSLLYRKTLRLKKSALASISTGQLVNLLSTDVNSFNNIPYYGHILCQVPMQTMLIMYGLYYFLGITSIIGATFLLILTPLQGYLGKKVGSVHLKALFRTDERVRLMNEIITSIKVIKMYTWEKPLIKLVDAARRAEIKHIRNAAFIKGSLLSFWVVLPRFANFLSIITYTLLGNVISASYAFLINAFYKFMGDSVVYSLYLGIPKIAEANVSLSRIRNILLLEEMDHSLQKPSTINATNDGVVVHIHNAFAKWSKTTPEYTLKGIYLNAKAGELIAIVGPVGSGKSSLLNIILRELPITKGSMRINGSVSYAPQEPWLFSGTVKQNILFGENLDLERYKEVVRVCALEEDFLRLPYGDNTSIGEKGTMLSGGQKARISLARAIYRTADIYLLDDSLSAIDTHVGKEVFENCILGFLKTKCRIIVTHQLQYLGNVHQVILIENGTIATSSDYTDDKECGINFVRQLSEGKEDVVTISNNSEDSDTLLSNHKVLNETPFENKEKKFSGSISANCYLMYFKSGGSFCMAVFILILFGLTQLSSSGADYFIAHWVNSEQDLANNNTSGAFLSSPKEISICIYSGLMIGTAILALSRTLAFCRYCMLSSTKLHDSMFSNIIHAPMQFFNTNASGRILNRFSRDIGVIDDNLPVDMFKCIQVGLTVFGIMTLVCVVYQWLFAASAVILAILYILKVVYSSTSRDLKRLEGSMRSPVYAHMCETIRGLTTIRAFGNQDALMHEFDNHQDKHSSSIYLYITCWRAFCLWLEIICTTYIAVVIFAVLFLKDEKYGGSLGLTITQAISLTGLLQKATSAWCELENQMTSVERVVEYTKIITESSPENSNLKTSWPVEGDIDFQTVSLQYFPEEPYVLKDVDISISAKEKIGIVGRTGAGKSSLITALFQLSRTEGSIVIDNVNISDLPLSDLRQKISIIPQEPILFSGTFRKNLDPFDEYTDTDLWDVLEEVSLKKLIRELPMGLNSKVLEGGCNFSIGQKQLICLARAIIKRNKILVLDEATANVDVQTDALIQKTIRRKFRECTVLTVAHRLNTIMDSHKVLVMDEGRAVEFDHPYVLLKNESGAFYSMVKQTGSSMSKTLAKIAKASYKVIANNT